jgi:hypothetical protein
MKHLPVDSSNIRSVGYDHATRTLEVIFHNGGHFSYAGVTPETHAALIADESPGGYFHREIRNMHASERVKAD